MLNRSSWFFFIIIAFCYNSFANSITKIVNNGSDNNRIVFVITGDGYREQDKNIYNSDADTIVAAFKSRQPFAAYWQFFNWYRLDDYSVDSGVSLPEQQIVRNTLYGVKIQGNTIYASRPVTDNVNKYINNYDCVLLVANSGEHVGVGHDGGAAFAKGDLGNVACHEVGHAFGGLADEYVDIPPASPPASAPEPNVAIPPDTAASGPHAVKWAKWLTPGVPIPTPDNFDYTDAVGVFDGAKYSKGCFKPESQCMMRFAAGFYCRICTEAIVLKIKKHVSIIENRYPPPRCIIVASPLISTFLRSIQQISTTISNGISTIYLHQLVMAQA